MSVTSANSTITRRTFPPDHFIPWKLNRLSRCDAMHEASSGNWVQGKNHDSLNSRFSASIPSRSDWQVAPVHNIRPTSPHSFSGSHISASLPIRELSALLRPTRPAKEHGELQLIECDGYQGH